MEVERPADVEEYLAVETETLKAEGSDIVAILGYESVVQPMCDWVIDSNARERDEGGETDGLYGEMVTY